MTDHIKMAALARHLHESVLQRATDAGIELPFDQVAAVMQVSISLARVAYGDGEKRDVWAEIERAGYTARTELSGGGV